MTYTLARFLTAAPAGLYRWTGGTASAEIAALCRLKRIELFRMCARHVRDKRRFLATLAKAMRLPRWFGMNWDALADCLTDFTWQPGSAHVLFYTNLDAFAQHGPVDFTTALSVLEDAADFWAQRKVRLLVLIECDALRRCVHLPAVRLAVNSPRPRL